MLSTVVVCVYVGLFVYFAVRSGLRQWLTGALVLAAGGSWLLSNLLPGFVYYHGSAFLNLAVLYITLSSLFFFVNHWHYHSATGVFYAEPDTPPYLVYLAVSGMMMHLAWLIPLLWSSYQYPEGLSSFSLLGLLQLYFLQPIYWIGAQWSLIAMFFVVERWRKSPLTIITMAQLQFAFLFGLFAVTAYVIHDLSRYLQ